MRYPIKSNPMPPRWITVVFLFTWAVSLSWLAYRDLLPDLWSDEPVFYYVEVADEQVKIPPTVYWSVERNGLSSYSLQTTLNYDQDEDVFELHGNMALLGGRDQPPEHAKPFYPGITLKNLKLINHYWFTRQGRLETLDSDTHFDLVNDSPAQTIKVSLGLHGKPRNGKFAPILSLGVV